MTETDSKPATAPSEGQRQEEIRPEYRKLPGVDRLLQLPEIAALASAHGSAAVTAAARAELAAARAAVGSGLPAPETGQWVERITGAVMAAAAPSLRSVINATGVLIHTNLGRTPLSEAAKTAVTEISRGYSTLEYDLETGGRGSRHSHPARLLCELTGGEDALVVNNNAAAVFLALSALCVGREVVVSRGELVEIGGGFRIPDVLRQSGATLVEVGTTNRTHAHDFRDAINAETAALMRIHASNFKQIGFVKKPELSELVAIAGGGGYAKQVGTMAEDNESARNVAPLVIDDLGSGTLLDTTAFGLANEPTVQSSVQAGADLVTFSGDKLLGGPQAGLIVGRSSPIARLRAHPLARALRVDKMTLAALDATLRAYQRGRATSEIPVWRMIAQPAESVQEAARRIGQQLAGPGLEARVVPGRSAIGGGSLPGETLPTFLLAVAVSRPDEAASSLRQADPPVICRIRREMLLFDLRTVLPEQEQSLLETLSARLLPFGGREGGSHP